MTYKESLTAAMTTLGRDPQVRFVGYGVRYGGRAAGTLRGVAPAQCIETPVAENLMASLAIGLALRGLRPVVYFERYDFILNALDAIVNHLDKLEPISGGEFNPAVILRVVAGNTAKPLFTGATHTQNFTAALRKLVRFPIEELPTASGISSAYACAHAGWRAAGYQTSTLLVEFKDLI